MDEIKKSEETQAGTEVERAQALANEFAGALDLPSIDHDEFELPEAELDGEENQPVETNKITPIEGEVNTENWDVKSVPAKYYEKGEGDDVNFEDALVLPSVNYRTFIRAVDPRMEQITDGIEKAPSAVQTWFEAVAQAVVTYPRLGGQLGAVNRPGADWRDHVDTGDRQLRTMTANLGENSGNALLTGVQAIAKATAFTSVGAVLTFKLPHSLIWLTVKAPNDGELLELERRISIERAIIGRNSQGRIFSQTDVIIKGMVLDLIFRSIIQSTYYTDDPAELRKAISQPDIEILIANYAAAIYPNGYPLVRPCLADPDHCHDLAKGRVSIVKMIRYDNNAFTHSQRMFLARRVTRANPAELKAALDEFPASQKRVAIYTRQIRKGGQDVEQQIIFTFRTPSVAEYLESGYLWISELEAATDTAFGNKISITERDEHINNAAEAAALRQYSHWVESIQYRDEKGQDSGRVENVKDLYNTLERYSSDEKISDFFFEAVKEYIDSVTVAIVAIPSYDCPACKKEQPTATGKFNHLIPIDASEAFFTIQRHRSHTVGIRQRI